MLIMIAFLASAGIFDHLLHRIPGILTAGMLMACLLYNLAVFGPASLFAAIVRMAFTTFLLFPVFAIGALGAGDVKLFAICCGFMEGSRCLLFVFFSLLIACVFGLIKTAVKKDMLKRLITLKLYVTGCMRSGRISRYHCNKEAEISSGIPLGGAMFVSALIGIGGFY